MKIGNSTFFINLDWAFNEKVEDIVMLMNLTVVV